MQGVYSSRVFLFCELHLQFLTNCVCKLAAAGIAERKWWGCCCISSEQCSAPWQSFQEFSVADLQHFTVELFVECAVSSLSLQFPAMFQQLECARSLFLDFLCLFGHFMCAGRGGFWSQAFRFHLLTDLEVFGFGRS